MSEGLTAEIEALQERESYFKSEIARVELTSPLNMTQYKAFEDELRNVQVKLDAKRAELESVESAAVTAQEAVFNQFEQLDFGDTSLTLREMCADETYYQLLSGWIQKYVGDMAQSHAAIVASYKSQNEALSEQVVELDQYRKQSIELTDKLADMELRRDAAAEEIATVKEENQRLAADNESLRKQLEKTTNNSGPTNLNSNLAELAKQKKAEKPGIYNKRWGKNSNGLEVKTHYIANLSATGEEIEIPYLEVGKYREETAEEAETFRAAEAAKLAAENPIQNSPLVIPPLPSSGEPYGLDPYETVRNDDAPATLGELKALEARIVELEKSQRSVA